MREGGERYGIPHHEGGCGLSSRWVMWWAKMEDWSGLGWIGDAAVVAGWEAKTVFSDVIPQARVYARLWGGGWMIIFVSRTRGF